MFKPKLSKILDECLERILTGEATMEACLRLYPEHAEKLAPMLALALETRASLALQKPKPSYVEAGRQRIIKQLSRQSQDSASRRIARKPAWRLKPAQAFLSLMLVLSVLMVGAGVVQASAAALPGDAFYGLKLGLERAQLALSLNAAGDMDLLTRRADTRLDELQNLVGEGKGEGVGLALDGYGEALSDLTDLATTTDPEIIPGSLEHVLERLAKHQDVLVRVLEQVPPSAQPAIEHAMQQSSHSQEVIQQVRQGGNPGELAPGQQQTPPGQERTPPGQERTPPGQERTPPGHGGTPPGQDRTPTPEPPPPTQTPVHTLHVSALTEKDSGGNAGNWIGRVEVTVVRDDGQPVSGVVVYGKWTYARGEPFNMSCNPSLCSSNPIKTGATTATFTITNVTGTYPWDNIGSYIVVQAPPPKK